MKLHVTINMTVSDPSHGSKYDRSPKTVSLNC